MFLQMTLQTQAEVRAVVIFLSAVALLSGVD